MNRYLLAGILFLTVGCAACHSDPSQWKTGQVLSESTDRLGAGFRLVHREIVNPPEHWEGVGHFSFLYYHNRELCRCSQGDFSIAPSRRYALFQGGPTGKLFLFDVRTKQTIETFEESVGSPKRFVWDEAKGTVTVLFYQDVDNGNKKPEPLTIRLP